MARRSDHSRDEIKQMAINVAESLVEKNGPSHLTARRVAAGIGYTVGSLYLVFTNLDELALYVNAKTLDRLAGQLDETDQRFAEPEACVVELGRTYIRFAAENPHLWKLVFETHLADDREIPDWYQSRVLKLFQSVENQFTKLRPDLSPESLHFAARALWSGVHGVCILAQTNKLDVVGIHDVERTSDLLCRNFLAGWIGSATDNNQAQ